MKKILIIGGTQFVGRNLVEHLMAIPEYDITLFNRGRTNPDLFPELKKIKGDRDTDDLHKVAESYWDCIIDISCYNPKPLKSFIEKIIGNVGRYIFISTMSVYDFQTEGQNNGLNAGMMTEEFPRLSCTEEDMDDRTGSTYGKRKVACEDILLNAENLDTIILRPALIIGNYDHTDRLYYWYYKVKSQDEMLIPNADQDRLSYTDVNDLSQMIIRAIDIKNAYAVYNAASYTATLTDFIHLCKVSLDKEVRLINASLEFIQENNIDYWSEMPLWLEGDALTIDCSRIEKDFNFDFSSIEDSHDHLMSYFTHTMKWRDIRESKRGQLSMEPEREKELMEMLKKQ